MYASFRRYAMGAGSRGAGATKELMRRCEEGLVPAVNGLDGFVGLYVIDAGDGIIGTISIFESEPGLREGDKAASAFLKEKLSGLLQANPQVTSGPVPVHKP